MFGAGARKILPAAVRSTDSSVRSKHKKTDDDNNYYKMKEDREQIKLEDRWSWRIC